MKFYWKFKEVNKKILRNFKEKGKFSEILKQIKGESNRLLIHDFTAQLKRGHGQMDFYLTQIMSSHRAFNIYLFNTKLVESPECTNCDTRGRDYDNA